MQNPNPTPFFAADNTLRAGDTVTVNQILVEVETAKSLVELPSPWEGAVLELLAQVGETLEVGAAENYRRHHELHFNALRNIDGKQIGDTQTAGALYKSGDDTITVKGDWGAGSVQLTEIPTVDETFDNIVAFWNPKEPVQPGQEYLLSYKLHWGATPPATPPLATVQDTRTGLGGELAGATPRPEWQGTPARPTILRFGAAAKTSASTWVAERTRRASASTTV